MIQVRSSGCKCASRLRHNVDLTSYTGQWIGGCKALWSSHENSILGGCVSLRGLYVHCVSQLHGSSYISGSSSRCDGGWIYSQFTIPNIHP